MSAEAWLSTQAELETAYRRIRVLEDLVDLEREAHTATRQALKAVTVDDPLSHDDEGSFCFFCAASVRWFAGESSLEHSSTCSWAAARAVLGDA